MKKVLSKKEKTCHQRNLTLFTYIYTVNKVKASLSDDNFARFVICEIILHIHLYKYAGK